MSTLKIFLGSMLLLLGWLGGSSIEARYVPQMPHICNLPPPHADGICTIEIEGFFYDPATLDCQMYTIGACHVTPGQSFGSQQDCIDTCIHGHRRHPDYYRNK
ncbi:kunitz-type serine protease inhibitor bitisilin-2 [Drosophila innubila]|uniref:kunitz-type serine protease inhibitor bitisilin-2 n=1 Tax=Drosophila innubila TaxID=198719 RepID=UPI00148C9924|nr:kunitz-type serine protease inhibitor bitisilin-2 [Drosophila innubila]